MPHPGDDPTDRTVRVRVPGERTSSPVIRRERRTYFWRTAAVGACCTVAALLLHGHGASWLSRIILLLEIAADLGCYCLARQQITAVKTAEDWYAGHRQIVATDSSWRTDPPRFPARWLIPALAVIAVTVVVPGADGHRPAAGTDRDDDRFWKAGLIYVNHDDPALLVGARFGVGWTFNLANPVAWLVIAATVAMPAGLAAIAAAGR